jgi:hypothetical protein
MGKKPGLNIKCTYTYCTEAVIDLGKTKKKKLTKQGQSRKQGIAPSINIFLLLAFL